MIFSEILNSIITFIDNYSIYFIIGLTVILLVTLILAIASLAKTSKCKKEIKKIHKKIDKISVPKDSCLCVAEPCVVPSTEPAKEEPCILEPEVTPEQVNLTVSPEKAEALPKKSVKEKPVLKNVEKSKEIVEEKKGLYKYTVTILYTIAKYLNLELPKHQKKGFVVKKIEHYLATNNITKNQILSILKVIGYSEKITKTKEELLEVFNNVVLK